MYPLTTDFSDVPAAVYLWQNQEFLNDHDILTLDSVVLQNQLRKSGTDENRLGIDYENDPSKSYRNSYNSWISYDRNNTALCEIFSKIYQEIITTNQTRFHMDLTDVESFQYTQYQVGHFYKKHMDTGTFGVANTQRKLSFTIQLTDPQEYKGGDVCVYVNEKPMIISKQRGSISFFPSYMLHEVRPVTQGTRRSLVGWVWGPRFR